MKTIVIRTVVENKSRYGIDFVWENAQDLEHVAYLHGNTNSSFELLHVEKVPTSPWQYKVMVYRGVRKLFFLRFQAFGFRTIISDNNLHQVEHIPLLRIRSALNSMLVATGDPEFPTLMRDEVVMEVPWYMAPLKNYLQRALKRHASIQCQEDEPFRARRTELKRRGVNLPYRIFFESTYERLTARFQEKLPPRPISERSVPPPLTRERTLETGIQ